MGHCLARLVECLRFIEREAGVCAFWSRLIDSTGGSREHGMRLLSPAWAAAQERRAGADAPSDLIPSSRCTLRRRTGECPACVTVKPDWRERLPGRPGRRRSALLDVDSWWHQGSTSFGRAERNCSARGQVDDASIQKVSDAIGPITSIAHRHVPADGGDTLRQTDEARRYPYKGSAMIGVSIDATAVQTPRCAIGPSRRINAIVPFNGAVWRIGCGERTDPAARHAALTAPDQTGDVHGGQP